MVANNQVQLTFELLYYIRRCISLSETEVSENIYIISGINSVIPLFDHEGVHFLKIDKTSVIQIPAQVIVIEMTV